MGRFRYIKALTVGLVTILAGCTNSDIIFGGEKPETILGLMPESLNSQRVYYSFELALIDVRQEVVKKVCKNASANPFTSDHRYLGLALGESKGGALSEETFRKLSIAALFENQNTSCIFGNTSRIVAPYKLINGLEVKVTRTDIKVKKIDIEFGKIQSAIVKTADFIPAISTSKVIGIFDNEENSATLNSLYGIANEELGKLWNSNVLIRENIDYPLIQFLGGSRSFKSLQVKIFFDNDVDDKVKPEYMATAVIRPKFKFSAWVKDAVIELIPNKTPDLNTTTPNEMLSTARSVREDESIDTWSQFIASNNPNNTISLGAVLAVGNINIDNYDNKKRLKYIIDESIKLNKICQDFTTALTGQTLTQFDKAHLIAEHIDAAPLWKRNMPQLPSNLKNLDALTTDTLEAGVTSLKEQEILGDQPCLNNYKIELTALGFTWLNKTEAISATVTLLAKIEERNQLFVKETEKTEIEIERVDNLGDALIDLKPEVNLYFANVADTAYPYSSDENVDKVLFQDASGVLQDSEYSAAKQISPKLMINYIYKLRLERYGCIVPSKFENKKIPGQFEMIMTSNLEDKTKFIRVRVMYGQAIDRDGTNRKVIKGLNFFGITKNLMRQIDINHKVTGDCKNNNSIDALYTLAKKSLSSA